MIRFTSRFTPPMTSRADETRSKERHKEKLEVLRVSQFRLTKTVCGKTLPLSIVFFLRSLSIYRRLAVIVRPTITTSAWHSSIAFISNDRSRQRHDTPRRVEPRNCARGSMTTVDRKVQNTLIPGSSTGMAEVQPVEFSFFFFSFLYFKETSQCQGGGPRCTWGDEVVGHEAASWWDKKRGGWQNSGKRLEGVGGGESLANRDREVSKKRTTRAAETLSCQGLTFFLIASRPKLETTNGVFLADLTEKRLHEGKGRKEREEMNERRAREWWSATGRDGIRWRRQTANSYVSARCLSVGRKRWNAKYVGQGHAREHRVRFLFLSFSLSPSLPLSFSFSRLLFHSNSSSLHPF